MKTFAELKRDLKKDVKLKNLYNYYGHFVGSVRPISKVQTNGIYLLTMKNNNFVNSWLEFPKKASDVIYNNNIFSFFTTINNKKILVFTYEIIK